MVDKTEKEKQLRTRLTKSNLQFVKNKAELLNITMSSAMNEIIREARKSSKDTNNDAETIHISMV